MLKRLAWLFACIGVGSLVGYIGASLSGNAVWYVAVPVAVAFGWLFFADPSRCTPPARRDDGRDTG